MESYDKLVGNRTLRQTYDPAIHASLQLPAFPHDRVCEDMYESLLPNALRLRHNAPFNRVLPTSPASCEYVSLTPDHQRKLAELAVEWLV